MPKASATAVPRSFSASRAGVIRGFHMYQTIWTPYVREKPTTAREPGNEHDRSASNRVMQSKIRDEIMFDFYIPGTAHFTQISATLLANRVK